MFRRSQDTEAAAEIAQCREVNQELRKALERTRSPVSGCWCQEPSNGVPPFHTAYCVCMTGLLEEEAHDA